MTDPISDTMRDVSPSAYPRAVLNYPDVVSKIIRPKPMRVFEKHAMYNRQET